MFRRIIATSPTWITIPLRLALAAVFIAHGAQKGAGRLGRTRILKVHFIPGALSLHETSLALDGRSRTIRIDWWCLDAVWAADACRCLLSCLHHVRGSRRSSLASFFSSNKGFEYPLALLAMSLALLISGGGIASIDLALTSGGRRR